MGGMGVSGVECLGSGEMGREGRCWVVMRCDAIRGVGFGCFVPLQSTLCLEIGIGAGNRHEA